MVDAPLQDTASVAVSSNLDTVSTDRVVDELVILRGKTVQALLNDMVAIEVLDQCDDTGVQRNNDNCNLLRGRQELNHLLDSTGAVHVQGNVDQLGCNILNNDGSLFVAAKFQELLAQVVAERIYML
jgi:hypothetical protein